MAPETLLDGVSIVDAVLDKDFTAAAYAGTIILVGCNSYQVKQAIRDGKLKTYTIKDENGKPIKAMATVDPEYAKKISEEGNSGYKKGSVQTVEGASEFVQNGLRIFKDFDVNSAYVKPKHLETSGGNGAKFLGNSKEASEAILREVMKNGKIVDVLDNGLTRQGNQSYEIIIEAVKEIGTKGEQLVKIILSDDGGMLSAYPIK